MIGSLGAMLDWRAAKIDDLTHCSAMHRLLLMRHAKSDWSISGAPDRQRPLNARGRAAAPLMGTYLSRHGLVPDRALISAAVRARQTWDLLAPALGAKLAPEFEDRLYSAGPAAILALIHDTPDAARSLLVVGHNPGLHALAAALAGSGDSEARKQLNEKFPTAGLAVIDFSGDAWSGLRAGQGRLERFVTPRDIAANAQ